jgi:putative membrane protein
MYWYDHMGSWGYAGMGIVMVLFWALLIVGVVALVIFVTRDRHNQESPTTPERMLAARFARGEISETEYRDRLAVLREPSRQ